MSATVRGRINDLSIELEAHSENLNTLLASPGIFPLQLSIAAQRMPVRRAVPADSVVEKLRILKLTADFT